MSDNIKILKNYVLYFLTLILICIIGISNVFGATISDYATKYYYYSANDNSSTNSTVYRSGDNNFVTLFGAEPPTYDNGEGFNGFYNRINYSIVKGNIYTLNLVLSYSNLQDSEFSRNDVNNRLLNTNFAHCSDCSISSVSGFLRRYNASAPAGSNLYDFTVSISYTFVATSTTNQWYIGTYTGDDRVLGVDNHLYTSIVSVTGLTIEENNSSTIINQNDTIINQNNQIIEQNNQNTQDIINNNNTNTNNIMNNNNQNTQEQIESQKVCNSITPTSNDIGVNNALLNVSGNVVSNQSNWIITDYYEVQNLNLINRYTSTSIPSICYYNSSKTLISCNQLNLLSVGDITLPINTKYIRYSIAKNSNLPLFKITVCQNGNQALNDSISGLNDSLNDDDSTGASSEASEFFSSFTTNTFGLTSIITAPLNLIQSLTSSTCSVLHLPLPYLNNKYLDLPCMTSIYQTHFGAFFTMYQTITYGIIAYWVCVRIFNQVKDFKNPEHDEIEVVDL